MNVILIDENNTVTGVIIAESVEFIQANADKWPHTIAMDGTGVNAGIGYTYNDDGTFSKAPEPEPEQQYQTVMDSQTFMLLLTRAEMKALQESTNEIIQDTYHLFEIRNGEVNTESDIFKEVMAAAVTAGVLTQERADELSLGKPV